VGYETDISTELLAVSCTFCGKPLRVPESLERGYGPDCDEKYMGGSGAAMVSSKMQSLFDEVEAEAALRSAPTVEPEGWLEATKLARKGQSIETPDGAVKAKGGEILQSRPLNPGSLQEYWRSKGGDPDDPRAAWRTDPDVRQAMVSYGIWYASRAVTFGFPASASTSEKVDPRFMVVASVQRFARAVGLVAAADRMANFYAARVAKVVKARLKETGNLRSVIVFETEISPEHRPYPGARRGVGPGMVRLHAPYSEQYNRLARENRDVFVASEKDAPYFWRYFHKRDLRKVINILQACFGDRPSLTRKVRTTQERAERERMTRILDSWTGEVRLFSPNVAHQLLNGQPTAQFKTRLRYQEI
jgi:hypothetical protein